MNVLDHMSLRELFDRQEEIKVNLEKYRTWIVRPRNTNLEIKTFHATIRELEYELNKVNQKLQAVTFVT